VRYERWVPPLIEAIKSPDNHIVEGSSIERYSDEVKVRLMEITMAHKITSTGAESPDGTTQTSRATDHGNYSNCLNYNGLTNKLSIPSNFSNYSGDVNGGTSIATGAHSMPGSQCIQCFQCYQCDVYSTYNWAIAKTGTCPGKLLPF
jgi:hypothetical protein